jgi:perosamine synthetase
VTYVPADPLLDLATLRATVLPREAAGWPGLPPETIFMESGRAALWGALRALNIRPGERLILPAYICDSVLPACTAIGVEVRYVPTDRFLQLDLAILERELAAGARAALLVHYFGLPAPGLQQIAELCTRYDAALIEDCAHALFSHDRERPLGALGAAAIFCLWKSLPLPDGGALVLNGRTAPQLARLPRPPVLATARGLAYRAILTAETVVGHSPRLWLLRSTRLRRAIQKRSAGASLAPRRSSTLAEAATRSADWARIVSQRRANYSRLESAIRKITRTRPLYNQLPDGACPLAFPILVENREQARHRLLAAGLNVRAYWEQLPLAVSVRDFADAHYIADRILVLPVHQSLSPRMMNSLIGALGSLEAA